MTKKEEATSSVTCKCKNKVGLWGNAKKCLCITYENLRAYVSIRDVSEEKAEGEEDPVIQNYGIDEGYEGKVENGDDQGEMDLLSSESRLSCVKRRRDRLLKEARNNGPLSGYGRVAHLVKASERLFSIPSTKYLDLKDENESKENKKEGMKWAFPGLQQPKVSKAPWASSFDLLLTAEKLGLDS